MDKDTVQVNALLLIISPCIIILINKFFLSPLLSTIHNIEKPIPNKKILRVQNIGGKLALYRIGTNVKELIPFKYDKIYPCGSDAFICESGTQKGVYNTSMRKMTIAVGDKDIEILGNDTLKITVGKKSHVFTTKGFRVVS